jgi:hypothetical protein
MIAIYISVNRLGMTRKGKTTITCFTASVLHIVIADRQKIFATAYFRCC